MEQLDIYDPAMCCSTGVCGPAVDPELIRMSLVVNNLKKSGVHVSRFNLTGEPQAFVENAQVKKLLEEKGPGVLPVIIADGQIVKQGSYPTNDELVAWTGISSEELIRKPKIRLELKHK